MDLIRTPELIAPAGDRTALQAALQAGADAVYFGAEGYNMRQASRNFSATDFADLAALCTSFGAKSYLALNTIIYDSELETLDRTVAAAAASGIDAVICWDMAVVEACRRHAIPFHLSTQASVSNFTAVRHYAALGARMIVLARELTLEQAGHISAEIQREGLNVQLECFIHGAMCVAVSGRCFLSQEIFGRSANRGECLQPCRRSYRITDSEEGFEFELGTSTVMNPRDLCTITFLDQLLEAGISGLKIEGRNRSPEYVATTTATYRRAIDFITAYHTSPNFRKDWRELSQELELELDKVYHRGFSSGFYFGRPLNAWSAHHGSVSSERKTYIGTVTKYYPKAEIAELIIHSRGLDAGERISIQGPTTGVLFLQAETFHAKDKPATHAEKGDTVTLPCPGKVRVNDKVYVLEKR